MNIQQRLLKFVTTANWLVLATATAGGALWASAPFMRGILFGGLIVTINFHLLYRTLRHSLTPPHLVSHNVVLAKYYLRFLASGIIIFMLIYLHIVHPLGLFVGLSVVVVSITLATVVELKNLFVKEAA